MHLAIDAVGTRSGGGATVLLDLLDAARADTRIARISAFATPEGRRTFRFPDHPGLEVVACPGPDRSNSRRAYWRRSGFARQSTARGADVALGFNGMGLVEDLPTILFVQQPLLFDARARDTLSLAQQVRLGAISALTESSCRSADRVIVQTPWMRRAIIDQFGLDEAKVEAILHDCSIPRSDGILPSGESSDGKMPSHRVLYVGSTSAYKSVDTLLDAFRRLRKRFPDLVLELTWPTDHPAAGRPGVRCLGVLSRREVVAAYRRADVLVMPSLTESLGLPQLEAMACGCPVVAADLPYAREVCGGAAAFFRPGDPADCAARIAAVLDDPDLRADLVEQGIARFEQIRAARPFARIIDRLVHAAERRM